jgi:phosphopantothenoylcysteine decarboxylase / phosphopantothenate---cysteine ligase
MSQRARKHVLVTAGPTREHIDPVRYISNPSSGKMGYAVARAAARRGGDVVLVSGPTGLEPPAGVRTLQVTTAEEMAVAVDAESQDMDLFVAAAAVSDWRPQAIAASKVKKRDGDETLHLVRTPDILAAVGSRYGGRAGAPVLVGFAAETEDVVDNAREKLLRKRCDLVVGNLVGRSAGSGFAGDTNRVAIVSGEAVSEAEGTKDAVADAILDRVMPLLERRPAKPTPA